MTNAVDLDSLLPENAWDHACRRELRWSSV